ncbi:MAG: patatin-like phospholipase family protein [Desulfobacterales bacterium]|jgi:NTE family protein
MRKRPKLGLALGAGGARGIAHVGVLKVLQREGVPIDLIVGTSIGALVGAAYAANPDAFALARRVYEVLDPHGRKETRLKLLERSYWDEDFKPDFFHRLVRIAQKEMFLNFALFRSAVLSEQDLRISVEAFVPDIAIEDTRIPYFSTATDLLSGRPVVLKQGPLIRAVMASCAVPGFMPSIEWDGKLLVDGGLINMVPVIPTKESGADVVVGVDVGMILKRNHPVEDGIDAIHRATEIMNYYLGTADRISADVLIEPVVRNFGWTDFFAFEELIHQGELAAEQKIDEIKQILKPGLRNKLFRRSRKIFGGSIKKHKALMKSALGEDVR